MPIYRYFKNEKLGLLKLINKINSTKTNGVIDFKKNYVILMQHPVTTEF